MPTLAVALGAAALLWGAGAWLHGEPPRPERRGAPDTPAPAAPAPVVTPPPSVPPEPVAPSRAAPEPVSAAWFDAAGEPSPELMRAALAEAIAEKLPGHKLSSDELDRLAEAAVRLREAQRALRALPQSDAHAAERGVLVEEIRAAGADFAYVLEMTPGEFTAQVQTDGGIDRFAEGEEVPEPEYLDDLR